MQAVFTASVTPELFVGHLATRLSTQPTARGSHFAPPPPGLNAQQYCEWGAASIVAGINCKYLFFI